MRASVSAPSEKPKVQNAQAPSGSGGARKPPGPDQVLGLKWLEWQVLTQTYVHSASCRCQALASSTTIAFLCHPANTRPTISAAPLNNRGGTNLATMARTGKKRWGDETRISAGPGGGGHQPMARSWQ